MNSDQTSHVAETKDAYKNLLDFARKYRSSAIGIVLCLFVGYLVGSLVGHSKFVAVIIALAATAGVGAYFYRYEKETWRVKFLTFILFEMIVAAFVFETCFS
jgi:hypothetical protein